jgi:hypothetical protein
MTTREPLDELGLTREKFKDRMLGLIDQGIEDDECILPCAACFACHFLTCRKAGLFQLRQELLPPPGVAALTSSL